MENGNTKGINEMLQLLSEAPDSQLASSITKRLKDLIGKPKDKIKVEVMHCIDDCVHAGLSSGLGLKTLNILHEVYLDGSIEDFTKENCPWR